MSRIIWNVASVATSCAFGWYLAENLPPITHSQKIHHEIAQNLKNNITNATVATVYSPDGSYKSVTTLKSCQYGKTWKFNPFDREIVRALETNQKFKFVKLPIDNYPFDSKMIVKVNGNTLEIELGE